MPGPVRKVLIDTILQRRARMLIHQRKHVDPRQLSRLHQPLPLRLPKIRGHRDHRILHRHLRVKLCQLQCIPQNHSRQFLGRVNPLVGLNRGGAPQIFHGGKRQRAARPAASSPIRRLPSWKATRAGDLRLDISLIATEIGVWPGFRFTTATFSHSEPRSMLDTAAWAWIEQSSSRDNPSPNLNKANDIFSYWKKATVVNSNASLEQSNISSIAGCFDFLKTTISIANDTPEESLIEDKF
ncbi:hypothetical protein RJ639_016480 [Escallonia herrerae]|uniref:Uncharacterized protein n=1 Tax=Escallonia herrerae TaxID=1293975 RepID=A0AA88VBD9_9ASTE|nr:hypothetical protein RJ639_016480 [Escallonia herrerae]